MTTGQNYRTISIAVDSSAGALAGSFALQVAGHKVSFAASQSSIATDCSSVFSVLANVGSLTCAKSAATGNGGATYAITIQVKYRYPIGHKCNLLAF
jgi:hypothetical protein